MSLSNKRGGEAKRITGTQISCCVAVILCQTIKITKAKPSRLPDSNVIFFVATKKTKQKKAWRCAGHAWRVKAATSIQVLPIDQEPTFPPQDPRLLRGSPFVVDCSGRYFFSFCPLGYTAREAPITGRLIKLLCYWMSQKTGKGDAVRKECTGQEHSYLCI